MMRVKAGHFSPQSHLPTQHILLVWVVLDLCLDVLVIQISPSAVDPVLCTQIIPNSSIEVVRSVIRNDDSIANRR